jgi:hypothetical protein
MWLVWPAALFGDSYGENHWELIPRNMLVLTECGLQGIKSRGLSGVVVALASLRLAGRAKAPVLTQTLEGASPSHRSFDGNLSSHLLGGELEGES